MNRSTNGKGDPESGGPSLLSGTYSLESIDGNSLPLLARSIESLATLVSGDLRLDGKVGYVMTMNYQIPDGADDDQMGTVQLSSSGTCTYDAADRKWRFTSKKPDGCISEFCAMVSSQLMPPRLAECDTIMSIAGVNRDWEGDEVSATSTQCH